jgi:ribosomal protein S18 acetylase RimI-like enzyme
MDQSSIRNPQSAMIRTFEELGLNAWPSLQTVVYDGWILRFAHGYTRRANSINPLYPFTLNAADKIKTCEELYRGRGLNVVFKMTQGGVYPQDLDAVLAEQGYAVDAPTSLQVLDLADWPASSAQDVTLTTTLDDEWLAAFCRLSSLDEQRAQTLRQILNAIVPTRCLFSICRRDRIVACGMGVLQDGYVGLYDLVTDLAFRRQGLGERLVRSVLTWGASHGAHTAYLQVMLNNVPASRLYAKLGYTELYQYWYRVLGSRA